MKCNNFDIGNFSNNIIFSIIFLELMQDNDFQFVYFSLLFFIVRRAPSFIKKSIVLG